MACNLDGYVFYSFEYDWDAQREKQELEAKGFVVKLKREKTDTKGLKMYSVWIKLVPMPGAWRT